MDKIVSLFADIIISVAVSLGKNILSLFI
jgi:hypothetical protein